MESLFRVLNDKVEVINLVKRGLENIAESPIYQSGQYEIVLCMSKNSGTFKGGLHLLDKRYIADVYKQYVALTDVGVEHYESLGYDLVGTTFKFYIVCPHLIDKYVNYLLSSQK